MKILRTQHAAVCAASVLLLGAFALGSAPASAHVVLEYQVANAGSYYKANFKVGHGCGASPTRQITVNIPSGVKGAKPMPKPGWALEISREKLDQPYVDHGLTVAEEVARITWTAKTRDDYLPNAHYDEFALQARLPNREGTIYWGVNQVCEEGRNDWTQTPGPGQTRKDLKSPAPVLELLPVAGSAHGH